MTETDKLYYTEMLKRDRLIPFFDKDKLICFITFFIGNNKDKYITENPWEILDDEPNGKVCIISQLLTDKTSHKENHKLCIQVWKRFKDYIKLNFPEVKEICWHRFLNGKINIHKKEI